MKKIFIYVFLSFILSSCYKESDYNLTNMNPDDVISNIAIENDTILANGKSSTKISVEIPVNSDDDLSSVKISTSAGEFQENNLKEITKDAKLVITETGTKKIAEFTIISSLNAGKISLEITVQNVSKTIYIYFGFNYPEKIRTTPSALQISPSSGDEIEITTKISSNNGLPSIGQKVDLYAKDSVYNCIGSFRVYNNYSNASSETSYSYSLLPDTTYFGRLYLISSSIVDLKQLTDTVIIYSKNY